MFQASQPLLLFLGIIPKINHLRRICLRAGSGEGEQAKICVLPVIKYFDSHPRA